MKKLSLRPIVLIILDGLGIAEAIDTNAVWRAKTPFLEGLIGNYPTTLLQASGLSVGLPWGEMGNSEVGHLNIGAGFSFYQNLPRIDRTIENKSFFKNQWLLEAVKKVKQNNSNLHLLGLLGNGGVHAHDRHLAALVDFCKKNGLAGKVFLHLFLDGRDSSRDSGQGFLREAIDSFHETASVASISGRFYAMDRNENWDRIAKTYQAIALGQSAKKAEDPIKTIEASYKLGVYDEEFVPTVITDKAGQPMAVVKPSDVVIFYNFRADRARQLTQAFVQPDFKKFKREFLKGLTFITMTEYEKNLPVGIMFPTIYLASPLAKVFSDNGLKQLHLAETEKYAHVTFFLNGMHEEKFPGEERALVPSPAVTSYDQKPEMSALALTAKLLAAIKSDQFDFIVVNYANPDMVGHTGNLPATIKAIETVDNCLAQVAPAVLEKDGAVFLVGDHGNAEEMMNLQTGQIDKEHSTFPVPFIAVAKKWQGRKLAEIEGKDLSSLTPGGVLADVAPTILAAAGIPLPEEMTGANLL
ncbi:MAG: 2,3-bisphosphoglycerate-independent phosphoglycerate mutase [bacterium]